MPRVAERRAEKKLLKYKRRCDELEHVNRDLRAKLETHKSTPSSDASSLLDEVPRFADIVTNVDQARTVLAELNARIADGLAERDALLTYIYSRCPVPVEQDARERLPQTHNSRIMKLRIGPDGIRRCKECGQPSKESCSAHLFLGMYDDGRIGECFVQLGRDRRHGLAGGGFHMAARMASLALQHHAPIESVIRQFRYHNDASGGRPYGCSGPLKEPSSVKSLADYIGWVLERVEAERIESGQQSK